MAYSLTTEHLSIQEPHRDNITKCTKVYNKTADHGIRNIFRSSICNTHKTVYDAKCKKRVFLCITRAPFHGWISILSYLCILQDKGSSINLILIIIQNYSCNKCIINSCFTMQIVAFYKCNILLFSLLLFWQQKQS